MTIKPLWRPGLVVSRRRFLAGLGAALAAPAIIRPANAALQVNNLTGFGAGGSNLSLVYLTSDVEPTNSVAKTWSGVALGTAAFDRVMIVALGYAASPMVTLDALEVAGVAGTMMVGQTSGGSGEYRVELWRFAVPSGTSGDIDVTWSGTTLRSGYHLWAMTGANSTPHDTGNVTNEPLSDTINVPAGGGLVGAALSGGTTSNTWTNLTERSDTTLEGGADAFTGASDTFAGQQSGLTITCDPNGAPAQRALVLASFAPA